MSRDLQAAHQILALLESSKSLSDSIFDEMPGLSVVTDRGGKILRANIEASRIFGVPHENAINHSLSELFSDQSWQSFRSRFQSVVDGNQKTISFEHASDAKPEHARSYLWQIRKLEIVMVELYSVVTRDITDLKRAHETVFTLEKDIEISGTVHSLLLPQTREFNSKKIHLIGHCQSAAKSGGDWWWYKNLPDDSVLVIVGDVTGHGIGAAMITSFIAGAFRAWYEMNQPREHQTFDIHNLFSSLSRFLAEFTGSPFHMSMVAVHIDHSEKLIRTWAAAPTHAPVLIRKKVSQSIDLPPSSPLGYLFDSPSVAYNETSYLPGDRLILLTDGLTETRNDKGRFLGLRRMDDLLKATSHLSVSGSLQGILGFAQNWRGTRFPEDDMTIVLLDLESPSGS